MIRNSIKSFATVIVIAWSMSATANSEVESSSHLHAANDGADIARPDEARSGKAALRNKAVAPLPKTEIEVSELIEQWQRSLQQGHGLIPGNGPRPAAVIDLRVSLSAIGERIASIC